MYIAKCRKCGGRVYLPEKIYFDPELCTECNNNVYNKIYKDLKVGIDEANEEI